MKITDLGKAGDKKKLAHANWVANEVEALFRSVRSSKSHDVQKAIETKYGVDVSYFTTWNAWTICMERTVGSYDEGYIVMLELTVDSIEGFLNGCRPLLELNGCLLKEKYGVVCLSMISLDRNNGLFPVAVFFCRSECHETWHKFLEMMKPYVELHKSKLTFISDRQKGLIEAVGQVFPYANYKYYFRHMYKNMKYRRGTNLEK
ncbi:hypothetical protein GIB67_012057 [Kingdonia uniflora]|uniref:MULE transposase domain-containing protein n=1 Tax=Kingdonia uniflora TaxID=39325 RepID=A0A7J7M0B6_9MAGN|nr:hypothetical protein GIB67_012057 [Kingdonia uniflora]